MKHFILAFLIATVCYAVFYQAIEHRRTHQGPWEVTFITNTNGAPTLVICQPRLAITNVQICFPDQSSAKTNPPRKLVFNEAKPVPHDVPFGKCVFMDLTFLPGTVTFDLFGHEIELLPRVLMIDHQERPWLSDKPITLHSLQGQAEPARH